MCFAKNLKDIGYLGMLLLSLVILTAYNQIVILFHQSISYLTTVFHGFEKSLDRFLTKKHDVVFRQK